MKLSTNSYKELVNSLNNNSISKEAFEYIKNKYYQKINKPVDAYN